MARYEVKLPITGYAILEVEADAGANNGDAETQKDEAAGTNPEERMPTASVTEADVDYDDSFPDLPQTHGPQAVER